MSNFTVHSSNYFRGERPDWALRRELRRRNNPTVNDAWKQHEEQKARLLSKYGPKPPKVG